MNPSRDLPSFLPSSVGVSFIRSSAACTEDEPRNAPVTRVYAGRGRETVTCAPAHALVALVTAHLEPRLNELPTGSGSASAGESLARCAALRVASVQHVHAAGWNRLRRPMAVSRWEFIGEDGTPVRRREQLHGEVISSNAETLSTRDC